MQNEFLCEDETPFADTPQPATEARIGCYGKEIITMITNIHTDLSAKKAFQILCKEANIRPADVNYAKCSKDPDGLLHLNLKTEFQDIEGYVDPAEENCPGLLVVPTPVEYPDNMPAVPVSIRRVASVA
jgi:hypothetical protein